MDLLIHPYRSLRLVAANSLCVTGRKFLIMGEELLQERGVEGWGRRGSGEGNEKDRISRKETDGCEIDT